MLAAPEIAVGRDELGFQFGERANDLDLLLAGAQHDAAGQVHGRVLGAFSRQRKQRGFLGAVDHAADVRPVDGARAHRARLEGRDQRAAPQVFAVVFGGGATGELGLGVANGIDVALAHQDRVVGTNEHRAKGMMAFNGGFPRDGVGGAEGGIMASELTRRRAYALSLMKNAIGTADKCFSELDISRRRFT